MSRNALTIGPARVHCVVAHICGVFERLARGRPGELIRQMSDKEAVLELVQKLPAEATLEEVSREVSFLAGLRQAEEQAERGDLIDHDRIREDLQTWSSS